MAREYFLSENNMSKKKILVGISGLGLVLFLAIGLSLSKGDDELGGFRRQRGPNTTDVASFASINADLLPDGNNTRDVGAFGSAWNNLFVSSTAYLGNVTSTSIEPWANNTSALGAYGTAWSNIFASGTAVLGNLTSNGQADSVTIGTSTASTLTVTARLAATLNPNANNTIDLGAFGLAYNNLFASGTVYTAGLTIDGNTTVGNATSDTLTVTARLAADLNPNANNTIDLGAFGLAYNNLFASGTSYLGNVTSTSIEPWANNTSSLGAYNFAFRNVYASSTSYLDYVSSTQITAKSLPNSTQTNSLCYNTTNGTISYVSGDVCSISLLKFKENIHTLNTQGKVYDLQPVRFNYKDTGRESIGLIAEEVEKILPELAVYSDKGELQTVAYDKLPVVLLEEMKKLESRVNELESRLSQYEDQCFY